jgi:cell division initiation protein
MPITPVEIHHLPIGRRPFGYQRSTVDRYLDEIAASFEVVWRERADLADQVEALEEDLQRHRELESLLRQTLISAEKAAQEQLESARKQAEVVVAEAHAEARSVARAAQGERDRLERESQRIQTLLRSALIVLEDEPLVAEEVGEGEVRRLAG